MQNLSHSLILLNGEPKTKQIESIIRMDNGAYRVRFKKNIQGYYYCADKVLWLTNPKWIQPEICRVYRDGSLQTDVIEIWKFESSNEVYWRIKYRSGYEGEYNSEQITVHTSCLSEKTAQDTLSYLRQVANINPLHNEYSGEGILSEIYEKVSFINSSAAAACYLSPNEHSIKKLSRLNLIYPFGCNTSQKAAVTAAFKNQISVIQGPPGTGKTQTILNIIANAVRHGKTVLVVSNNNSATGNVLEKLEKYGMSFIVAALGKRENKEKFITEQPSIPAELQEWELSFEQKTSIKTELNKALQSLDNVYSLQNELARLTQEQQAIELEWKHFIYDNGIHEEPLKWKYAKSSQIINLWLGYQTLSERQNRNGFINRLKLLWLKIRSRLIHGIKVNDDDLKPVIDELQKLYYLNRSHEIENEIRRIKDELSSYESGKLSDILSAKSMELFKDSLYDKYEKSERTEYKSVQEMRSRGSSFTEQYPVVLSTTFSATSCIFNDQLYDYIIMDEASQVSIETGALALTCAKNAVIVGDNLQLPNVVTDDDRLKLDAIMEQFNISEGYDCAKNSFLKSICSVIKDVPQTLLREHYRCHPKIINFCNQRFYGGELLIMTKDNGEKDVLCAYKTVKGNHAVEQFNQREIDVIKHEVLPDIKDFKDIGIVTPDNRQVKECLKQLPDIETATIHKYQGREKDAIIMSTVDNQITEFADNPNLINVAVSRAKEKFCLVVTGNEQEKSGHIMDLLDYINYNNFTVTGSKIASIFDYLYDQYTEQRIEFIKSHKQISEYASENFTYALLSEILATEEQFSCLKVLCHIPLRQIIKDSSLLSEDEARYASHYNTHVDFLIINRVTKKPVLAIETDGYSYHNDATEQHKRDLMKNRILTIYELPLIRLSTKGSNEKVKVAEKLSTLI